MKYQPWLVCLRAFSTLVLFLVLSDGTSQMNAQEQPGPRSGKVEMQGASEESPIEKLGKMIAGTWAIDATTEPGEAGRNEAKTLARVKFVLDQVTLR